jgi:F-type H+-transporting ATPase subunit b
VFLASSGLNLLQVNPGLVIWTLVTFSIVVIILKRFAWDKILHALEERANKIQGDIEKADTLRKSAEASLKSYEDKLHKATEEVHAMIEEGKQDAARLRQKLLEDAQAEVKGLKDQSLRDIEQAKGKAISEMQHQIVELSVLIAGEILEKQLKKEDFSSFVEKEISKLDKLKVK